MRKKSMVMALVLCLTMILSAMGGLTNRAKADTASSSYKAGDNGYQFRCVVTDANGQTASKEVTLTVK